MKQRIGIGVDLGGTKIEAVIVREDGALPSRVTELARRRVPTEAERGYDVIVERTAELVRAVAGENALDAGLAPIGVGMPGGITRREGLVKNSNTVCLNGRPFRSDLERALGRPVAFENDANCFALAETLLGAATEHRDGVVFGVILGTGVGAGVVMRGEIWGGAQGIAGEWGHQGVWAGRPDARPCYCGLAGCLERYASGPAVEEDYRARTGRRLGLAEIVGRRETDPAAAAAVEELVDSFGRGLANVIDILDPSIVVLGGGVSNLGLLYDEGARRVERYVLNDELVTPIVPHRLGDSAGVLGAALLGLMRSDASGTPLPPGEGQG